jgi:hypothetical protein
MGPEIQAMFLQIVVPAAFTVLAALITFGGKKLIDLINVKTKNAVLAGVLARLVSTVQTVVLDLNGTMKADMINAAKDGKITDDEKAIIRAHAIAKVKAHLGAKGLAEIVSVLGVAPGLVDSFIGSHLEAAIESTKFRGGIPPIDPTVSSTDPAGLPANP